MMERKAGIKQIAIEGEGARGVGYERGNFFIQQREGMEGGEGCNKRLWRLEQQYGLIFVLCVLLGE